VFTDPELLEGEGLVERQEESISFPLITFSIKRYDSVAVRFRGQKGKEEKRLKGPIAWAFQQGLQQLNGTVPLDWRVNHGNFRFTS
jgi:peptide deformylase